MSKDYFQSWCLALAEELKVDFIRYSFESWIHRKDTKGLVDELILGNNFAETANLVKKMEEVAVKQNLLSFSDVQQRKEALLMGLVEEGIKIKEIETNPFVHQYFMGYTPYREGVFRKN